MSVADAYGRAVLARLQTSLVGLLDSESPPVHVEAVRDVTGASEVLAVEVTYRFGDASSRYRWADTAWEEYAATDPASMAEGLAVLIRTDIRERVATPQP